MAVSGADVEGNWRPSAARPLNTSTSPSGTSAAGLSKNVPSTCLTCSLANLLNSQTLPANIAMRRNDPVTPNSSSTKPVSSATSTGWPTGPPTRAVITSTIASQAAINTRRARDAIAGTSRSACGLHCSLRLPHK